MAEKAAHISFTSHIKPSIFEIVAQNSLNHTLKPALQRILEFLAESKPNYFQWLATYDEESFLVFNGLLQYYYLKTYDTSFPEYFYGLKRISFENTPLSNRQRQFCFLFLVILPYIKRKLEAKLNIFKIENAEGLLSNDFKSKSKKAMLYSQSTLEITWSVWLLLNYLRYMADDTDYQNPIFRLLKVKLIYTNEQEDSTSFWSSLFKGTLSFKEFTAGIIQNGLRTSLEIGAFFVQFLQAWYKEKSNYSITALPTVPPPTPDPNSLTYKGKCPICLQPWKIPTILAVSGYVFCFSCLVKHLREEQKCPVTNYPAKQLDIIRVYDS